MIPEWKQIRKRAKNLEVPNEPYFALADEYVELKAKFVCEDIIETIYLWADMLLYPIYITIRLCMQDFSITYIFALTKTYQLWFDWLRLQELEAKFEYWKLIIRRMGGPWISSNNPDFHIFVYADGMERIRLARSFRKTEKKSPKVQRPVQ
jgi:hypothetical protein